MDTELQKKIEEIDQNHNGIYDSCEGQNRSKDFIKKHCNAETVAKALLEWDKQQKEEKQQEIELIKQENEKTINISFDNNSILVVTIFCLTILIALFIKKK